MELLPMAIVTANRLTRDAALSARPDAPVVTPPVRASRLPRTRRTAAELLTKAAQAITPTPTLPSCDVAH